MQIHLTEKIDSIANLTLSRFSLVKSAYNGMQHPVSVRKICLLPLENNTFTMKEPFRSGKNQIQVGHVILKVCQLRSYHKDKFIELKPNTEAYRNSFYCRTIKEWNSLPI